MKQVPKQRINLSRECDERFSYWTEFIKTYELSSLAEVGVWEGAFAAAMLEKCPSIENYIMIDPWAKQADWNKPFNVDNERFDEVYRLAQQRTEFAKHKITTYRETTKSACKKITNSSLDFIYIDGDHTLRGISIDLICLFPKVKYGGVIAGDDFTKSPWQHSEEFEPTMIFPFAVYFAEAMDIPIYSLGANQFCILNRPDLGFSFTDMTDQYGKPSLQDFFKQVD